MCQGTLWGVGACEVSVGPWGVWRIVRDARLSSQATRQLPLHVSEKIGSRFQRNDLGSGTEFKV